MIDALYILSWGRSGSTLLDLILGSHSEAVAVGELTHLPKNQALDTPCSCGATVRQCDFWQAVLERMSARLGVDVRTSPYALELGYIGASRVIDRARQTRLYRIAWRARHALAYIAERGALPLPAAARRRFDLGVANTFALYDAIRAESGARVVVDASKAYLKGVALYSAAPHRVRLILLTRDGRACLYSSLKSGFPRDRVVREWRDYYRRVLPLIAARVRPEHLIRVRYEDLAHEPEREVARICRFAGLEYEPSMLDVTARMHHLANGNDMRLRRNEAIRIDTEWEERLAAEDRRAFEALAGALNRRFGYV